MKKPGLVLSVLLLLSLCHDAAYGQAKIRAYFNHPVNSSLSSGVAAVYLPSGSMADTIVAYINRAKYSVDVAQYDYNQSTNYGSYASIAVAVNAAYNRGVTVRWIYDGSSSNGGLSALNAGIHTLGSPTTSAYGIMHNKFIIIDANSTDAGDPILWMGSPDWSSEMFYKDYNNILFLQDQALAQAYTAEFNMMWGSTTATPDAAAAKFGPDKTDLGLHTFHIAGHLVELYFSPSDNADAHVASTILTANKDLYVGVYCMTRTGDANNIVAVKNSGVYTLATVDQYTPSVSSSVNSILSSGLGSQYVVYTGSYIYHNKMMIVDPSDTCSDPIVLTGSYNWTSSANNYNDENILIIHNDTLANIYYQSYIADYTTIGGGSFEHSTGGCGGTITTSAVTEIAGSSKVAIYPNPATNELTVTATNNITAISIRNLLGQVMYTQACNDVKATINISGIAAGVYFVNVNGVTAGKFVKE